MFCFDYSYVNKNFQVKFKPTSREVLPWRVELDLAVQKICSDVNKPIYVLLSGGVDSEVLARVMLSNDIPFKVLTFKHKNGTNDYDTYYAQKFCEQHNVEMRVVSLDIQDFFDNQINNYIKQGYRATNVYHYQQLFMLEQLENIGGFGIGAEGTQVYYTKNGVINLKINPSYTLGMDWCKNNNVNQQLWYLESTPELYASYMNIDIIEALLKNPLYFNTDYYDSVEKTIVYHGYWPDMERRIKTGGFQYLKKMRKDKEDSLQEMFPDLVDYYFPIKQVKKELYGR